MIRKDFADDVALGAVGDATLTAFRARRQTEQTREQYAASTEMTETACDDSKLTSGTQTGTANDLYQLQNLRVSFITGVHTCRKDL